MQTLILRCPTLVPLMEEGVTKSKCLLVFMVPCDVVVGATTGSGVQIRLHGVWECQYTTFDIPATELWSNGVRNWAKGENNSVIKNYLMLESKNGIFGIILAVSPGILRGHSTVWPLGFIHLKNVSSKNCPFKIIYKKRTEGSEIISKICNKQNKTINTPNK